ncbi:DUF742 domain-containing protein [Mangrovihabitans endophyticus]|uniref:DUF742 domain-containing protein n=1 Tax=Mangrovihabitans endophyticus TaxID=1751298 RepID=A0A8J3BTI8_9ACTN|nr:DUF742 domain-containing protein [Mangrovihabitans endophyticus]GGK77087.1 hypothetical protein GCM10012284_08860 [Mangrovihabitans endophyticus]
MSQPPWGPDPRMIPYAGTGEPPRREPEPTASSAADSGDELVVRPFMLTGGRTRPLHDGLRIETLLRAAPAALSAPLRFESRRIVELCQSPMSIADISVAIRAPLGVVRVIVADLVTDGYLRVEDQLGELPISLIERIRDRVRAL